MPIHAPCLREADNTTHYIMRDNEDTGSAESSRDGASWRRNTRGLALCIIKCKKSSNAWHKVGHNWHRQAWQRAWKQRPWLCSPHSPWCSHVFQASFLIDNSCFIGGNKISSESAKIRAFLTEGWQEDGIVVPFPGNYMYPAFIRGLCDILSRG